MGFLIGGFSSEQYKAYLKPVVEQTSAEEQKNNLSHWVAHFHLVRYSTLVVLVNRIAYFLLHRFAIYPNNVYLFQKFKSHDFTQIETEAQSDIAKQILMRFQQCSELDAAELEAMEEKLNAAEERLKGEIVDGPVDNDDAEAAKKKLEAEEAKKKDAEEAKKKKEAEDAEEAKKKLEAEEATKKDAEEAKKKKEIEEAAEAKKKLDAEEAQKQKEAEEAKKKKETEEAQKKKTEEAEEAKKKLDAEEAQKQKEAEEAKKKKEAEEAEVKKKKRQDRGEILHAKKRKEAEEAAKKKLEAEEAKKKLEAEEAKKKLEAEEAKKKLEVEEAKKKKEAEEAKKKEEAEEAKKKLEAEESKKKKEAEEAKKKLEAEEAKKKKEAEETKKKKEAEEAQQADKPKDIENANQDDGPKKLDADVDNSPADDDFFDPQDDETPEDTGKQNQGKDHSGRNSPQPISEDTSERLKDLFEELSQSQIEKMDKKVDEEESDEEESIELVLLPKEIDDILKQPFPLDDPKSINDLFKGNNSAAERALYQKNLKTLIHFANQLHSENSISEDVRFDEYMVKVDDAFQRAWTEAYQQVDALHAEFSKVFPQTPVVLNPQGEIVCTAAQFQWVTKTIAERFPAIYQLAFDAPCLELYQSRLMTSLARAIFVGKDEHAKAPKIESPRCICIREALGKRTPQMKDDSKDNPLLKAGNFILTSFVGPNGKIEQEADKLKKQLEGLVKGYVKDWLEHTGVTLEFGRIAIKGGQTSEAIPAGEWVAHVRDVYTKTLKNMDKKGLQGEIKKAMECPLVQLIAAAYTDDIEAEAWTTSKFPDALMKQLFNEELKKRAQGKNKIQKAILDMIDDTNFANEQDVKDLAKKADCTPDLIEPLIRIRVLYMICCLGQHVIEPAVRGIHQRAETMYDPSVCKNLDDPILVCSSNEERAVSFDATFDKLTMKVKTKFKDPHEIHAVAQGVSTLTVDSLSCLKAEEVETGITDIENLRFSLYASPEQMRYLVAQVAPETFIENVQKLAKETTALELVKKAERYQKAKQERTGIWNTSKYYMGLKSSVFNPKDHQELEEDSKRLDEAISKAIELVTYLNTEQMLAYSDQLSEENDKKTIKSAFVQIRNEFKKISPLLDEIYADGNPLNKTWNDICGKSKRLNELLAIQPKKVKGRKEDVKRESPTTSSSDSSVGKTAGIAQKIVATATGTFGWILNETEEEKFIRWKIERYEDLIIGAQDGIGNYLKEKKLGSADDLIEKAKEANAPEWLKKLLPLFQFVCKDLGDKKDYERFNLNYLKGVRDRYTLEMLTELREAVKWAKKHPTMPGVEHVNAICYQLYATLDLNSRCQDIFNTFLKLGQAVLQKANKTSLPGDPRYAMLNDLREANKLIHAVPNDAKSPKIKELANSLRGYFNGFWGVTTFDPNLQSNPMHVFFNKIIKKKGVGAKALKVKDIAMGSPTIENGNGIAEINPEFEGFLRHCQKMDLKHLYINNQNFTATSWVKGNEANRCQALHDLAENDFKDTLFVITLNQNTTFYQQQYQLNKTIIELKWYGYIPYLSYKSVPEMNVQKVKDALILDLFKGKSKDYLPAHLVASPKLHKWITDTIDHIHQSRFGKCVAFEDEKTREQFVQSFHNELRQYVEASLKVLASPDGKGLGYSIYYPGAKEFKEELVAQLFDRKPIETGNCIPDDLVQRFDLRNWSVNAIEEIHQKLFGGLKDLTIEERRVFIRIVYQNLARKILIETGADSYNASCKDRIDRGAATDAEDYAYLAVLSNCMNDPHVIEFFKMLVFARSIIVRKRTIIEERLERLIETVKFMIDNQKQLQALNKALFPDVEVTIDQFKLVEPKHEEKELEKEPVKEKEEKVDLLVFPDTEEKVKEEEEEEVVADLYE